MAKAEMALLGWIAPTDHGWYEFLSSRPFREEVNFWTPSAYWAFKSDEFTPFLFKLKAPHNAIAGFGYFARYSRLPDWLAWECFGEGNGCTDFLSFRERLAGLRKNLKDPTQTAPIGCIILAGVSFFPPEDWIPQPADWPKSNLRPMRYDLAIGEGARVWSECMARAQASFGTRGSDTGILETERRYGEPTLVRPRLGQGVFRVAVTDAYGRACAATREHSLPALEAAHIRPYSLDGPHDVSNGLLLRADIHRLLEQGYVTVTTDHVLEVSGRLREDYQNGRSYYPLHGREIAVPSSPAERPSAEMLQWHNENVFLG
ncbi:MAG: HNH endonuclease [Candidatus Eisenbacteria bacterium]